MSEWTDRLLKASFRGVPFAVTSGVSTFGRRTVKHEYPYRDKPWVEDVGRKIRTVKIEGFLVNNSLLYSAADVFAQRENLIAAVEQNGTATLVHPTYGELIVSIDGDLEIRESKEHCGVFEFTLPLVETGERVFAITNVKEIESTVTKSYFSTISTTAFSYIAKVKSVLTTSAQAVKTVKNTANFWKIAIKSVTTESANLLNTVNDVFGNRKYGRYSSGLVGGHVNGTNGNVTNAEDTADFDLLVEQTLVNAVVNNDKTQHNLDTLDSLNSAGEIEDYADKIKVVIESILSSGLSKLDIINSYEKLYQLENNTFDSDDKNTFVASLTNLYFKVSIAATLTKVASEYTPSSYDEAMTVLNKVLVVLDNALLLVGDNGLDDSYIQLKQLKNDIINAIKVKGANLAYLTKVTHQRPVPALTIANKLYQDARRADELIISAKPIHPAFMPIKFYALSK